MQLEHWQGRTPAGREVQQLAVGALKNGEQRSSSALMLLLP